MPNIEKAKNQAGKTIFPVTVADAVLMGNGKTLKGELSELGSEVYSKVGVEYNNFAEEKGYVNENGAWASTTLGKHIFIRTRENDVFVIVADARCNYAFFQSNDYEYTSLDGKRYYINESQEKFITIPKGCNYLYIQTMTSEGVSTMPKSVKQKGELPKNLEELNKNLVALESSTIKAIDKSSLIFDGNLEMLNTTIKHDGYYVSNVEGQSYRTSSGYAITDNIHINKGEGVIVDCYTGDNVSVISTPIDTVGYYIIYGIVGQNSKSKHYFVAIEDVDIAISYRKSDGLAVSKISSSVVGGLTKEIDYLKSFPLDKINEIIGYRKETIDIANIAELGYLTESAQGAIYVTGVYDTTKWRQIPLTFIPVGANVTYSTQYANGTNIVSFAAFDKYGTPIYVAKGDETIKDINYTAPIDCYVRCSFHTSKDASLFYEIDVLNNFKATVHEGEKEEKVKLSRARFDGQMLNIAYSTINVAPINTVEHFLAAIKFGFNSLKADMALTADNQLICCHDEGFTFNEGGRITEYDTSNNTPIRSLTMEQIKGYRYNFFYDLLGYYSKVCTAEEYLAICKEHGVIPFITLRAVYTQETYQVLHNLLVKYNLLDVAIINIYPPEKNTVEIIRSIDKDIAICFTLYNTNPLTETLATEINGYGNAFVAIAQTQIENSSIEYAKELGLRLISYEIPQYSVYKDLVDKGFMGSTCSRPFLPYKSNIYTFKVSLSDNVASMTSVRFDGYNENFTYQADIKVVGNQITINNISMLGSKRGFADGIPNWFRRVFPYIANVTSDSGQQCSFVWDNGGIHLNIDNTDNDIFTVVIVM